MMMRSVYRWLALGAVGATAIVTADVTTRVSAQAPGTGPRTIQPPVVATTAEARLAAWRQHQQMERESPVTLKWRAVGPRMQGGRIETVAVAPGRPSTIYAGAGSGGVFKSINNGTTWTPIFDNEATTSIGAIAVASSDANTVWVGTGEVLMARSSYPGMGVYKSTDAGASWTHMGLTDSHHISQVLIHPTDPQRVWVAAIGRLYSESPERGVFRTRDGGRTWQRTLFVNERTGAIDLALDPSNPNVLYASMWDRSRKAWGHRPNGPGSGAYKSVDGGETWTRLSGLPSGEHVGRIGLAIARSNPKVVYALVDNYAPAPVAAGRGRGGAQPPDRIGGEVYRSDDAGATWRKVNTEPVATGWDFCLIQVAPDNENIVYLPNNRFMASEDAGRTYRQIQGTLVHLLPHGSTVLHLDQHDLWINPANGDHMLLGNDGGLHLSYDRGASWLHLNNLPIGEFYAVTVDMATPYTIYGGTQDNAALFGSSAQTITDDRGDQWAHVYLDQWGGGDSYFTYRDPSDPDVFFYEHQFGDLRRKRMSTGRTDGISPRAPRGEPAYRTNWMTPFFFSAHDPGTMYYAAEKVFRSRDRGDTWTAISPDLTSAPATQGNVPWGTITTVSESPRDGRVLYTGADDGRISVTRDGGTSWTRIGESLPERWVSRLLASRHDDATVFAALTGYRFNELTPYLFVSRDYGRTWTSITSNLPTESINVVAEDPVDPRVLYIGTDAGVYASINQGASWMSLSSGLPTVPVHDLVVHPRDHELVVATHGRSIYVADIRPVRAVTESRPPSPVPPSGARQPGTIESQVIATAGDGSPFYRIPAMTTTMKGTLLAAYDARPTLADLPGPLSIVMRRSTDGGRTWRPQTVVRRGPAPEGYGDPSFIVDRTTGRIYLFHAASVRQGFFGAKPGNRDDDPEVLHADYGFSDDDGMTWTWRRLTSAIKRPEWGGLFAASGEGIQLRTGRHAGRLIQPYVIRLDGRNWVATAYSDNHGESWQMSTLVGPDADESKAVELSDGRLMLTIRAKPSRKVAWSEDGGTTWTGFRDEPALADPANNGSVLRMFPDAQAGSPNARRLLFSNTNHASRRENLSIRQSCDDGRTWSTPVVVEPGAASYSTLTRLPDGRFGLLYERGTVNAIVFAWFDEAWLGASPCGTR